MSRYVEKREELLRSLRWRPQEHDGWSVFIAGGCAAEWDEPDRFAVRKHSDLDGADHCGRLAEMMGLTTGAITGVINRMEKAGYVRREKDPNDGRRVVIQPILEELERVGAGFFGSQGRELEDLISDYDDRDLAVILDLMRKSNAVTSDSIARVRASSAGDDGGDFAAPGFGEERAAGVRQRGLSGSPSAPVTGWTTSIGPDSRGPPRRSKWKTGP